MTRLIIMKRSLGVRVPKRKERDLMKKLKKSKQKLTARMICLDYLWNQLVWKDQLFSPVFLLTR